MVKVRKRKRWIVVAGFMVVALCGALALTMRTYADPRQIPELQGREDDHDDALGMRTYRVPMSPNMLKKRIVTWADRNGLESFDDRDQNLSVRNRWGEMVLTLGPADEMIMFGPEGTFAVVSQPVPPVEANATAVVVLRERSFKDRLLALKRRFLP